MKATNLCAVMFIAIIFSSSCAASALDTPVPKISKMSINAQEFGLGEFMSLERKINSTTVDNATGAQYEFVDGTAIEGNKISHVGFYRSKVLHGENVKQATERVQAVCSAAIGMASIPKIEPTVWYNQEADKVSCLLFKKDITQ